MILRAITASLLFAAATSGFGQDAALDTLKVSDLKVDLAVPDMPAFRALGVDPTDILRPSDPKTLALMLAERASSLSVIPSSYAIELAPARLFLGRKLTVKDFDNRLVSILYNARLSAGSVRTGESGAGSDVAAGLRFTLCDDANLLRDTIYRKKAVSLLKQKDALMETYRQAFRDAEHIQEHDIIENPVMKAREEAYADSAAKAAIAPGLKLQRDAAKERDWNRTVVDFAYAGKWSSPDSFTKNLALLSHTAWLYGTLRFGSASQGLFGATVAYAREDTIWKLSGAIAARVYGGANNAKVFVQGQVKKTFADPTVSLAASGGMEILFLGGNWLEFTLAYEKEFPGGSKLTPGLKYNITLPESFTKF